jgi:Fe-S cluster assembly ATP-binding protein
MLRVEDLSVQVEEKDILGGINLKIGKGEIHALLGPNASGKSTLAQAIMGFPACEVTGGKISFGKKDITRLPIERRSKLGIALVFQHPPTVRGVTLAQLLSKVAGWDAEEATLDPALLNRDINVGFSGGERKMSEIMQVVSLNPRFVILDELDSGLDLKNLEKVIAVVKEKLLKNGVSLLLITHRGDILRFLEPDIAHVMLGGEIVCSSPDWREVWETIEQSDFEKCRQCPFAK